MSLMHIILGRLSLDSLPFWKMIEHPTVENIVNGTIATFAALLVILGAVVTIALITWFGKWKVLWSEWLTSVDHKRIGIMYIVLAFVMLSRALIEAFFMRTQQAFALNGGFLSAEHFGEFFTTHGTIMIFFMAMPFLIGVINYVMPLQIGARDVAFPVMNSISLGLTAAGAAIVMISLDIGKFSTGGWSGYPPYTEPAFNGGVGPDYWIWSVTLSTIATTMTGINFAVTIYKKRAPGLSFLRLPLFCWTALCTSILMIFGMPPLTVATALLAMDRYLDCHFFTNNLGGNMMNYANLFWLFGHPEVYILILPAFGVYSEVFSTYSGKTLYGYRSLVLATITITVLSFTVWVHHFFTMGQSANINAVFGIATMLIGIPTGVKVYDWMLTMFRGRVRFKTPLIYALGFMMLFVIGGMTGILLANPQVDYQVHNSLFLVAHFHNMLIPGLLFGMLAAYHFWFPKAFGFRLDETWGRASAFFWIIGFILAFSPLYALGILGFPRRTLAFSNPVYLPYMIVALAGAVCVLAAFGCLIVQFVISVKRRTAYAVPVGDPWDGRSLEWATPAPAPEYNFPTIPEVSARDNFTVAKNNGVAYQEPEEYTDISMPKNSAMGVVFCIAGVLTAFGLVWHLWWMASAGALIFFVATIARGFVRDDEKIIPAEEVKQMHRRWLATVAATRPVSRLEEAEPTNEGLAAHALPEASQ